MQIQELRLFTHNLDQQRDFYTRVLELPLSSTHDHHFALTIGASSLVFTSTAQAIPLSYHFAFNIPEHQFAEAKQWLAARVPLLTEPSGADELYFAEWDAHAVYFADPDGNIGELIARHTLAHPHRQAFTSASLLRVSEIGLVVDDVAAFVQLIRTTVGSPVYRGPINELFTPVGDEQGLLIVVKRGRLWLPEVRVAAMDAPLSVRISEDPATQYRIEGPPYRLAPA